MKKALLIFIFCFLCSLAHSQKNQLNLVAGMGPNFFVDHSGISPCTGDSWMIGINFLFCKKNRVFQFNPGISFTSNLYIFGVNEYESVGIAQRASVLNLDVLMKISRKNYFRFGLALARMEHSSIAISLSRTTNTYYNYSYSNNEVYNGYSCTDFQAGVTAGLSFPFKLFKRDLKFDVSIRQIVSPAVTQDYYHYNTISGENVKVIGPKYLPTTIMFAFEINLRKKKKIKKEEEE